MIMFGIRKLLSDVFTAFTKLLNSKPDYVPWLLLLRALPLYHWFVDDHPTEPFEELDIKIDSIMKLIRHSKTLLSSQKLR